MYLSGVNLLNFSVIQPADLLKMRKIFLRESLTPAVDGVCWLYGSRKNSIFAG